jgi:beta-glucosidase/6-phospho-beta-glucosidase/beta-galactosidase
MRVPCGVHLYSRYFICFLLFLFAFSSLFSFLFVYVNFETEERIPKKSFYEYQKIIQSFKNQ